MPMRWLGTIVALMSKSVNFTSKSPELTFSPVNSPPIATIGVT